LPPWPALVCRTIFEGFLHNASGCHYYKRRTGRRNLFFDGVLAENSGSPVSFSCNVDVCDPESFQIYQWKELSMDVQYKSLVLVIFNEEQLRRFQKKYYSSSNITVFDIAREMKADATDVINNFDFLDFAETIMSQADAHLAKTTDHQKEKKLLQRL
jgi:hypothetical protein